MRSKVTEAFLEQVGRQKNLTLKSFTERKPGQLSAIYASRAEVEYAIDIEIGRPRMMPTVSFDDDPPELPQELMLVFDQDRDPDPDEIAKVRRQLGRYSLDEVTPGSFRLTGLPREIEAHLGRQSGWTLSHPGEFSIEPPNRKM